MDPLDRIFKFSAVAIVRNANARTFLACQVLTAFEPPLCGDQAVLAFEEAFISSSEVIEGSIERPDGRPLDRRAQVMIGRSLLRKINVERKEKRLPTVPWSEILFTEGIARSELLQEGNGEQPDCVNDPDIRLQALELSSPPRQLWHSYITALCENIGEDVRSLLPDNTLEAAVVITELGKLMGCQILLKIREMF